MDYQTHKNCGGTILSGSPYSYIYCDRCQAFTHGKRLPTGTNEADNMKAWDAGRSHSPDDDSDD